LPGKGWLAITEAEIDNYAGMYLIHTGSKKFTLSAQLAPRVDRPGIAVEASAPMRSPWRVLMIGDQPGRLIESNLVLNLNEPSKLTDTSWIKPGKASWDWWSGDAADNVDFTPGMNTATMKHYIDFASQSGFPYMLIDAGWALPTTEKNVADITKVSPAIDMPELLRYARERHVQIWLWSHWTSVDRYMDQAFPLFEKWGIAGVKIDFMQRDDQWMVDFYQRVLEKAAAHHLMIDFHGLLNPMEFAEPIPT
jgi:alpha-glucosidase